MSDSGVQSYFCGVYDIIHEKCFHIDLGEYFTYGIKATYLQHVTVLHDVSVCEEFVAGMTRLFNRYQLSPEHLRDVVEDMLP